MGDQAVLEPTVERGVDGKPARLPGASKDTLRAEIGGRSADHSESRSEITPLDPATRDGARRAGTRSYVQADSAVPEEINPVLQKPAASVSPSASLRSQSTAVRTETADLSSSALFDEASGAFQPQREEGWWSRWRRKITAVCEVVSDVVGTAVKGVVELHKMAAHAAVSLVTEGVPKLFTKDFWSGVGSAMAWVGHKLVEPETWLWAGKQLLNTFTFGPKLLLHVIAHPVDSLQKAWGFVKDFSNSFGLSDFLSGIKKMCTGDFSGGWQSIKGAGQMFAEVTGLADVWGAAKNFGLALYCLGRGEKAEAIAYFAQGVMHASFAAMSIGSITATVATGGAAAGAIVGVIMLRQSAKTAAKLVLKTAAKEFLECAGKDIGKKVVKEFAEKVGPEMLAKTGIELADSGLKTAAKEVLGEAGLKQLLSPITGSVTRNQLLERLAKGLSPETLQRVFREESKEVTAKLMEAGAVPELVEKHALSLLKGVDKKSTKQLASELLESGLVKDPELAKQMAKDMKKALKKDFLGSAPFVESSKTFDETVRMTRQWKTKGYGAMQRAKADDIMKTILQEGVSKELQEYVEKGMKESFCQRLSMGLKGQLDSPLSKALGESMEKRAKMLGRDLESVVKENVEGAWKGVREGIEDAVKKAVREGLDEAFKKYRETRPSRLSSAFQFLFRYHGAGSGAVFGDHSEEGVASHADRKPEEEQAKGKLEYYAHTYMRGTKVMKDTMVRHEGGRWELASREELGLLEFVEKLAAEKVAEATSSLLKLGGGRDKEQDLKPA